MSRWLPILALLATSAAPLSSFAGTQLVRSYKCEDEQVRSNLHMTQSASVSGNVLDPSGAPFIGITLELRDPHDSKVLKSALADDKGDFDFGPVPLGEFRLVPIKLVNGKSARIPGFDPPPVLICSGEKKCYLRIILPMRATDLPDEFCPPR